MNETSALIRKDVRKMISFCHPCEDTAVVPRIRPSADIVSAGTHSPEL